MNNINNIIHLDVIDSTNNYLKLHDDLESYTLVYADYQTNGKGRLGRSWEGNKENNIYASMLIPKLNNDYNLFPLVAAVGIHKVLINYVHDILIKWPNDLLYNGLKVCGILCESTSVSKNIVVGFGINVNQDNFDESLKATSLKLITGRDYSIPYIIEKLYVSIANEFEMFFSGFKSYLSYLKDHLYGINKMVSFYQGDEIKEGKVIDLDSDGKLVIECNGETIKVLSGEIKIIR